MTQAEHILGYLQSNASRGVGYQAADMVLRAHRDASYIWTENDLRCRTGRFIFFRNSDPNFINGHVEVISTVHKNNVTCTAEAEYVAVFDVAQRLAYVRKSAGALGYPQGVAVLEGGNECVLNLANVMAHERKLRRVAMRFHRARDQVRLGSTDVVWRKDT